MNEDSASAVPSELNSSSYEARRGWAMAVASMVALIPSSAAIGFYTQGYFVEPMTAEFGWSRTEFMGAVSLALAALALMYPFAGYLGDRYGVRPIQLGGIILFALGTMSLSLVGNNVLAYTIVMVLACLPGVVQTPMLYAKAINSWAPTRNRGRTLAIAATGVSIGNFIIPVLTAWLISELGWRGARMGLGFVVLSVTPLVFFSIHENDRVIDTRRRNQGRPKIFSGIVSMFRGRTSLLLIIILVCGGIALNGFLAHFVPFLTDRGMALFQATVALSTVAISGIVGRLCAGWLLDKVQTPRIGVVWFVCGVIGVVLAVSPFGFSIVLLGAMALGLAVGAEVELAAYYVARYFNLDTFAEKFGVLAAVYSLGSAAGATLYGISYDEFQTYLPAALGGVILLIVSCLAVFLLPPYSPTEKI